MQGINHHHPCIVTVQGICGSGIAKTNKNTAHGLKSGIYIAA
jgi:hypothetical protein